MLPVGAGSLGADGGGHRERAAGVPLTSAGGEVARDPVRRRPARVSHVPRGRGPQSQPVPTSQARLSRVLGSGGIATSK